MHAGIAQESLHRTWLFLPVREDGLVVGETQLAHPDHVDQEPALSFFLEEGDGGDPDAARASRRVTVAGG